MFNSLKQTKRGFTLIAGAGLFSLNGSDSTFSRTLRLDAGTGAFVLTGTDIRGPARATAKPTNEVQLLRSAVLAGAARNPQISSARFGQVSVSRARTVSRGIR